MRRVMDEKGKTRCSGFLRIVPVLFFSLAIATASLSAPSRKSKAHLSPKETKKRIAAIGKQIDSVAYLREQRIKDSVQIVAKKERDRNQIHREIGQIEEQVRQYDASIGRAVKEKKGNETASRQKIEALKKNIQSMIRQKKENDVRKFQIEKEADASVAERNRIMKSSQSAVNRYERLRTPYEEAVKAAEADLSQIKEEQQILIAVRSKLRIDQAESWARDSLDKAIQKQAKRKRGAKKLVKSWEFVLDSLNSSQDALKRKYPTLSHRENMLPGMTLSQKMLAVDTAIARVEKKIPGATAPYERARKKLLAYEKGAPPPEPPSPDRLAGLDASIAEKKKDLFRMADISDSLGMKIEEARNTIKALSTPSQYGQDDDDAELRAKRKERALLAEKRIQLVQDSVRRSSKNESTAQRITGEIALFNNQIATLQKQRERLQESLAERAAAERAVAERAAPEKAVENREVPEISVAQKPIPERSVPERPSAKKPERQGFLSSLFQGKDYYSERAIEPEVGSISEVDIQYFQEKQKLESLIRARENAERDIANAEQTIIKKRKEIELQNKLIEEKQRELVGMEKTQKKYRRKRIASSPTVMNRRAIEVAQKRLEEIYMLLSDNDVSTAVQRFRRLRPFLKSRLDPEAYSTLVMTLEQMGAVLQ